MYFNTHTYLNSKELYSQGDIFIGHALDNSVDYIVVAGYDLPSSKYAVEATQEYPSIYTTVGISPNDCLETTDADLNEIETLLQNPCVVALGETRLDYYWGDVPHDKQKDVFQKQIDIVEKHDKPIVIHTRDAYEDTCRILKQAVHRGIMHCYSGSVEMAKRYIEIGFEISLVEPVTFENARVPKEVATVIGIDHLIIEADRPCLAPHPFRGKLNEPVNVVYIAQETAKLKDMEIEDVARITTFNAKRMFEIE